jgi:hypothetical protein
LQLFLAAIVSFTLRSRVMKCVVNVTDQEFAKILQLNHDALVWKTDERQLMEDLEILLGSQAVNEMRGFEECRMVVQADMNGKPRIEVDHVPNEPLHA